jgi:SAM-dependent methyltransferase
LKEIDFDRYADSYRDNMRSSLGTFGMEDSFFDVHKVNCLSEWVLKDDEAYEILDYGCGIGKLTSLIAERYSRSSILGYDISSRSIEIARAENTGKDNVLFSEELQRDRKYDLIVLSNVFHHVKPSERKGLLNTLKGLLKPLGKMIVFEHNPYNPVTRHVVKSCPFDEGVSLIRMKDLKDLAVSCGMKDEMRCYILIFPLNVRFLRRIEYCLRHVPIGCQYMLVISTGRLS